MHRRCVCVAVQVPAPSLAAPAAWEARLWGWAALRTSREAPRPLRHQWQHAALPSTGAKVAYFPSANTAPRFYMTFRHAAHPEAFDPARSILAKYDGRVKLGMLRDLQQPEHAVNTV